MSSSEAIELLLTRLLKRQGGRVYYGNAHTMVTAATNPALAEALEHSDLLLADGSGVRGSALLGTPLVYNLNGTDLVPSLCENGAAKGLSIYLLGAKPGIAEEAAANLKKAYPDLLIAGTQHGYFSEAETPQVLEAIRIACPHLLLVAMGVPLQEIWIDQYASFLPGITCMGVGGLFDFVAERVRSCAVFDSYCWYGVVVAASNGTESFVAALYHRQLCLFQFGSDLRLYTQPGRTNNVRTQNFKSNHISCTKLV